MQLQASSSVFDRDAAYRFSLASLTTLPVKAGLYADEIAYREGLYELAAASRCETAELAKRIGRIGLGVFRPDSIAHGKVPLIVDYLAALGLRTIYCTELELTPAMVREIWRYQLNAASLERVRLFDLLFGAGPSIVALFDCAAPVPCSVLMADAKGEVDPCLRQGWELRAQLQTVGTMLVHFHAADEPADVVRDGCILLGPGELARAVQAAEGDQQSSIFDRYRRLRSQYDGNGASRVSELDPLLARLLPPELRLPADRWELLAVLGSTPAATAGRERNMVSESGSDGWWKLAGLLDQRDGYLQDRLRSGSWQRR